MNVGIICYASVGGSGVVATELGKALAAPIGPAGLDGDVPAFDVTELAQSGLKGLQVREAVGGRGG